MPVQANYCHAAPWSTSRPPCKCASSSARPTHPGHPMPIAPWLYSPTHRRRVTASVARRLLADRVAADASAAAAAAPAGKLSSNSGMVDAKKCRRENACPHVKTTASTMAPPSPPAASPPPPPPLPSERACFACDKLRMFDADVARFSAANVLATVCVSSTANRRFASSCKGPIKWVDKLAREQL